MSKKKYYVSVQSRTIMERQGDAAYELEIEATPEELRQLQSLFEEMEASDQDAYFRTHFPGIPYHHDSENDRYDDSLKRVYRTLYSLGTEETKSHIAAMNVGV